MCQERFFALLLWHFLLYVAKSDPFWITTNVQEVKWKQDCPAVLACVDTTFVLVQNNVISKENISKSWKFHQKSDEVCSMFKYCLTEVKNFF